MLASALAIHSVEGRHAAALNTLLGVPSSPTAPSRSRRDPTTVLKSVKPFIVS